LRYCLVEYDKWMEITGYRNIAFAKAEEFLKANRKEIKQTVDMQFFDAELIASQEHLYFAALNALQAFQNKTNISKSPAMETMLYASAQRQIQRAILRCGIKPETKNMAVLIIGEKQAPIQFVLEAINDFVGAEPDEKVLEMTKAKEKKILKTFQITDKELNTIIKNDDDEAAVVNLVIERVALLSTQI
jgi:tRNA threonylcarbamoyladenosine modification (KEOPS) complex Cgi121 subunit